MAESGELFHGGEAPAAPFEVGPVISRAVSLLAHRVGPLARRFALISTERPARGFGSPAALVHAVTNLLSNALDAVDGAGPEARVAVRILFAAGGVEVRVSDEGTGIAPGVQDHLFEPLVSTKPAERGGGLGLHLSRRLMTRFGGEVFLVGLGDPARLPWAVTEFCIGIPAPPGEKDS